jgi:hypothetical protein
LALISAPVKTSAAPSSCFSAATTAAMLPLEVDSVGFTSAAFITAISWINLHMLKVFFIS